jgi:hypothetical protein
MILLKVGQRFLPVWCVHDRAMILTLDNYLAKGLVQL